MTKFSRTGVESGASDLSAIVPIDDEYLLPFGNTPTDTLQRHRAAIDGIDLFPSTRIMEAGNRFESAVKAWFEDDFNIKVDLPSDGFRSDYCNLVASVDGIIDGKKKPFSITDHQGVGHSINELAVIDFKLPTYKPAEPEGLGYHLQLQGQMECTGFNYAILAQLDRVRCEWTISVFTRHEGMIKAIRQAVNVFWKHMADDTDYDPLTTTEANRSIGGNRRPDTLNLVEGCPLDSPIDKNGRDELMNLAESYFAGVKAKKAGENLKEESQLAIQRILNGVEKVDLPGVKIKWTTVENRGKEESTKIVPAKPAYTSRRFSAKQEV